MNSFWKWMLLVGRDLNTDSIQDYIMIKLF